MPEVIFKRVVKVCRESEQFFLLDFFSGEIHFRVKSRGMITDTESEYIQRGDEKKRTEYIQKKATHFSFGICKTEKAKHEKPDEDGREANQEFCQGKRKERCEFCKHHTDTLGEGLVERIGKGGVIDKYEKKNGTGEEEEKRDEEEGGCVFFYIIKEQIVLTVV